MPSLWFFVIVVVAPVLLAALGTFAVQWLKLKEKQLDHAASLAADKAAAQVIQIERMEERMRVLERIVTDRGMVVADEIERLRDDRVN